MFGEPYLRKLDTAPTPVLDLDAGLAHLEEMVWERLNQLNQPVIVGIAGGSASGKSDAVTKFRARFTKKETETQPQDFYYYDREYIEMNGLNFDEPGAINLDSQRKDLKMLKNGIPVKLPVYQYGVIGGNNATNEDQEYIVLQPAPIIIVDGLFALDNAFKDELDIKVFVDIGLHGRLLRRLMRDVVRAGEKPADILSYFLSVVDPMHELYVETTKLNADLIIKNEYNPDIEAKRSGLHETQIKFNGTLDEEFLRQHGADRLGTVDQVDTYYNPKDRDLSKTSESVRIRREGDHRILTYKGPLIGGNFRERPKFEFEIDKATEAKFLAIYGDSVKVVRKQRTLYQFDGTVISLDKVEGLGEFIEFRSASKNDDQGVGVTNALEIFGLNTADGIKDPYVVM